MDSRLYKHLTTNDILYKKQFGFQEEWLTENAVIQLITLVTALKKFNFAIIDFLEALTLLIIEFYPPSYKDYVVNIILIVISFVFIYVDVKITS